jgi:hypothetical protein
MPNSSVNKSVLIITDMKDDGGITFPVNSNGESIVADMLKSIKETESKDYNVVPIGSDENAAYMIFPKPSPEEQVKYLEVSLNDAKEYEKELEDALVETKQEIKDKSDELEQAKAEIKSVPETTVSLVPVPAQDVSPTTAEDTTAAPVIPENFRNIEKFSPFSDILNSSTLTWVLVIILISIVLFLVNDKFKFIKL